MWAKKKIIDPPQTIFITAIFRRRRHHLSINPFFVCHKQSGGEMGRQGGREGRGEKLEKEVGGEGAKFEDEGREAGIKYVSVCTM